MRALITGGAGFIGSHLADRFLREGYEVRVIDNLDSRVHSHYTPISKDVEFIQADVRDRQAWSRALDGVEVISHQAAHQDYMLDFSRFLMTNAVSTALLYEVLMEKGIHPKKVIIASSQAVYGEGQYSCKEHGRFSPAGRTVEQMQRGHWEVRCPLCQNEVEPLLLREEFVNPVNQYAVSKLSGEQMGIGLGRLHNIPTVALRYSITQGPRQSLRNQYSGLMRIIFTRAMSGLPVVVYEDGLQTRDFVHIEDVVDANFCVLENEKANFRSFNVGGGRRTTVLDFAKLVSERLKKEIEILIPGQYRIGDNRHSISCLEALNSLGWKPKKELARNVDDFLAWAGAFEEAIGEMPDAYGIMQSSGVVQSVC